MGITMNNIITFDFYKQADTGVDVNFLFIEIGAEYGFQDLSEDYSTSNPYQVYISL